MALDTCNGCKNVSATLHYQDGAWLCRFCYVRPMERALDPHLVIKGAENSADPKGSTAHVRDIKDRRWHPTEKRMFYYSKELGHNRSYFFPK